ncbi:MAG: tRNA lysidine(34) synthetase TilS [Ilumatobacter sp.]|uniref:tRNA lysidine(34) synthetase TilS n=1 Tax=Ilumatobacter sp. TaxID=1967498 RepID=UPI00329A360D
MRELLARCTFPEPDRSRPPPPVTCALSGGTDSSALVALAAAAGCAVTAVHVHHGLRPSADHDATSAAAIAARLDVTFRVEHADLHDGPNLEARAREVRHRILGPGALFGHTADDQAETTLLAMLRGSGSSGLSAIRPGPTHPILALRRADTRRLCDALDLPTVTDPTNTDPRFRRNRVRHEVLPLLADVADRDPVPLLTRIADLVRDDDDFLAHLSGTIDPTDAQALCAAPLPLARRAIRRWLTRDGYPPDSAAVTRVLAVADGSAIGCEVAGIGRIRRTNQRLRVEAPDGRTGA